MRNSLLDVNKRNVSRCKWPLKMPLVAIYGRRRVLIENHCGVITYGTDEIRINGGFGAIRICGKELGIRKICREKLVISGVIDAVDFQGRL